MIEFFPTNQMKRVTPQRRNRMQAKKTITSSISGKDKKSKYALLIALMGLAFAGAPGHADESDEVSKLIQSGQFEQAQARADAYLANRPNDAQMRFLKGLILTERNKTAEAITVFTKLTEDFPELPEPYNNLAVLYAGRGEYEKARESLEMAIRTHPSYATAHENLGDVYAKLASQSYDKALQLDGRNSTAQTKLSLVRSQHPPKPHPRQCPPRRWLLLRLPQLRWHPANQPRQSLPLQPANLLNQNPIPSVWTARYWRPLKLGPKHGLIKTWPVT
jgi:tetratricopeptide (TPR) repeat protein